MKKLFLLVVAAMVSVTSVLAQSSMLATLSHNGDIRIYYGASALRDAHAAAEHGDVITLSSGTFNSVDITKAVTIRGAGAGIDTTVVTEPTIISGDFKINIADTVSKSLTLEGIYSKYLIGYKGTLKNARFLKCRLNELYDDGSNAVMKDASFIHCRIIKVKVNNAGSASFINSVVNASDCANIVCENCVVYCSALYSHIDTSLLKNCIIWDAGEFSCYTTQCYNCIGLNDKKMFEQSANSTNKYVSDIATVFKTYNGSFFDKLDSERFELTEAAKTAYLGADGTQVGIYGGALPYDPVPTNPQITKCNVASKSTADGKLSVDIQVGTAE